MAKKSAPVEAQAPEDIEAPAEEVNAEEWKRVYQAEAAFNSDLFRLGTAKMIKNMSWNKDQPEFKEIDHEHFYHTFDSGGKKMDQSTPTGNHFHVMSVTKAPNGAPIVTCSGPKVIKHNKGKRQIVDAPYEDKHTHKVTYERSSMVKPRTVNIESTKIINEEATKAVPIPGIRS